MPTINIAVIALHDVYTLSKCGDSGWIKCGQLFPIGMPGGIFFAQLEKVTSKLLFRDSAQLFSKLE